MASIIQVAAAQLVAEGSGTIASSSAVAESKQARIGEKRKEAWEKSDRALDRQNALERELRGASDDSFLEDAGEALAGWFGIDALFGGNEEQNLQMDIQKAGLEAQAGEAEGKLLAQDLQKVTRDLGQQFQSAQAGERQANAAVNEAAAVEAKAFTRGGAVQAVAPSSTAMAGAESVQIESAGETKQIAGRIGDTSADRAKGSLEESVAMKIDAIDEQLEGSFMNGLLRFAGTAIGFASGFQMAVQPFLTSTTVGSGVVAAMPSTVAGEVMSMAGTGVMGGVVGGAACGSSLGSLMGALGSYVVNDEAASSAAGSRADLSKVEADRSTTAAGKMAARAAEASKDAGALVDRVREQRNRLKVTV